MEKKCQISGLPFSISSAEVRFLNEFGLPFPRRSEVERLRHLLSFVPSMGACLDESSKFNLNSSNGYGPIPRANSILASRPHTEQLPDVTGEVCFTILNDLCNYWKNGNSSSLNLEYNYFSHSCTDIADTYFSCDSSELVQCIFVSSSKRLYQAISSIACEDCYYIENCEDCKYCLFCSNLKGVQYYIFNQEVSKDEYKEVLASLMLDEPLHLENAFERYANFQKMQIFNARSIFNSNVEIGRYVEHSDTSNYLFFAQDVKKSGLIFGGYDISNSYGLVLSGSSISDSFQSVLISGPARGVRNSYLCGPNVSNLDYCIGCTNSNHLMFCVGLDNSSYCIFNQQYSKEAYTKNCELLKSKFSTDIDWGYQLSLSTSLVKYNESLASQFLPLNKVQATLLGYEWNSEMDLFNIDRDEVSDCICEISGVSFSPIAGEMKLRSSLGLGAPSRAPVQRFNDLISCLEFGSQKESLCGLTNKVFKHYYRGNRLVVSC